MCVRQSLTYVDLRILVQAFRLSQRLVASLFCWTSTTVLPERDVSSFGCCSAESAQPVSSFCEDGPYVSREDFRFLDDVTIRMYSIRVLWGRVEICLLISCPFGIALRRYVSS